MTRSESPLSKNAGADARAGAGLSRRTLLVVGALTTGGWLAGCASATRQQLRSGRLPVSAGQVALNGWIKLSTDGTVTAVIARAEMGQGVLTGLMMLVAEELDCGWEAMRFDHAPIDRVYGNVAAIADGIPFRPDDSSLLARGVRWAAHGVARQLGFMMTGGSTSLKDLWQPMREAAAATRASLIEAVARSWQVEPSTVRLSEGRFSDGTAPGSGRSMDLGSAVKLLTPDTPPASAYRLKSPSEYRWIGRGVPRVDTPAKTQGRASFASDVRRPGMLYAAVRMSPVRGGAVRRVEATSVAAVQARPGVAGVVTVLPAHGSSGGVAVVADGWWRARRAVQDVRVEFDDGTMAGLSSAEVDEQLRRAVRSEQGFAYWSRGDAGAALASATRQLEAEYHVPYLAHATMEPMSCTVEFHGDRATVWAGTQVPDFARRAAAQALGLDAERVEMVATYLGSGFGRRLDVDYVAQAAQVARQFPGKAVQLIWSREDDLRHDFYRPACVARLRAGLDAQGALASWMHVSASQAITPQYLPRVSGLPGLGPDKTTAEGAFDVPYEFPSVRVGHVTMDLPVPVGYWRGVGHSHQAFFTESFIDECAHAAGADPLAFRLALLKERPRQRRVLELAAQQAGWGQPLGPAADGTRQARGLALHESFGSVVAMVVEASRSPEGGVRVHRVVCAIDCGLQVHPDLIAQQCEGSVAFGLSAALYGRIDIEQGQVKQGNFNDYRVLRLAQMPQVQTHIVPSTEPPQGVGEPMVPPVAPALANALFALDGQRRRSLPLRD